MEQDRLGGNKGGNRGLVGANALVQARDDSSLDESGHSRCIRSNCIQYILKAKVTNFADGLGGKCEKK